MAQSHVTPLSLGLVLLAVVAPLAMLAGRAWRRAVRDAAERARLLEIAQGARAEADAANDLLRAQAEELEQQMEEAQALAEELEQTNAELADALRAARESETQLRRVFTESPLPMWIYDPSTLAFLDVNDAALAAYGYSRDEFLAMTIRDIRPRSEVPRLMEALRAPAIAGRVVRGAHVHLTKDGVLRHVELTAQDSLVDGRRGRLVVVFDVTERDRLAEREHYLAEASRTFAASLDYRATLRQVCDLTVPHLADWCAVDLIDDHGVMHEVASRTAATATTARWPSWSRERGVRYPIPLGGASGPYAVALSADPLFRPQLDGDDAVSLCGADGEPTHATDLAARSLIVVPIVAHGRSLGAITLLSSPTSPRYVQADFAVVEEIGRRAGIAIDNAERYAAEFDAREAAELAARQTARLQAITAQLSATLTPPAVARVVLEHSLAALGALAGSIATIDESTAELVLLGVVGYPDTAVPPLVRLPLYANAPLAECVRRATPIVLATAAESDARYPALAPLRRSIGAGASAAVPLTVDDRQVGALGVSLPDGARIGPAEQQFLLAIAQQCAQAIERSRLYEAEEMARAIAEEANRAKSDFLATMSHELRTPLNAIAGFAQLLEEGLYGELNEAQKGIIGRMDRAQRHLLGLINDVLNYAKLEAGRVQYDVRETSLGAVLLEATSLGEAQLATKGIALEVVPCPLLNEASDAVLVWADHDKLRQVLLNVLSNAAKFTASGGHVVVECLAESGDGCETALVRITDTGIGIAPDKIEAIFEPFVQVDSSRTRTQQGTGLGLAISRDLARGMGGDLRAESVPGVGSTFTLSLRRVVTGDGTRTDRRVHDERRHVERRRRHTDRRH